eukprot:snap_masked-scaffold_2-processed-gene-12.24-mRNA-1 protein AED:1.00 eAED:1.00 QI:0/-1/0/0/-1/1/1/0/231
MSLFLGLPNRTKRREAILDKWKAAVARDGWEFNLNDIIAIDIGDTKVAQRKFPVFEDSCVCSRNIFMALACLPWNIYITAAIIVASLFLLIPLFMANRVYENSFVAPKQMVLNLQRQHIIVVGHGVYIYLPEQKKKTTWDVKLSPVVWLDWFLFHFFAGQDVFELFTIFEDAPQVELFFPFNENFQLAETREDFFVEGTRCIMYSDTEGVIFSPDLTIVVRDALTRFLQQV